ncbi:MAG: GNAT family N-acetyltransferase [Chloroflexi bacterium]|nr:GNAT family N-acetyltransferase [Chloroflexota bacterium]
MTLDEKYTLRHFLPDDYPALAELANASNRALGRAIRLTAEELASIVEAPGFNPRTDSFLLEERGRIVAMSNQGFRAAEGLCWADGVVHPDDWGKGLGAELIRLTEARCRGWAESAFPLDQPMSIRLAAAGTNTRADRLFRAHGYQPVRTFYTMGMELDRPADALPLPGGLTLRPFDPARDARAVYEAQMDAFADHWGFERDPYEDWTQQVLHHPHNDVSLWLVAYDGDEIAGICLNRVDGDAPHTAWVWLLGVRHPWRRRGVGEALLRMSLARLREVGYQSARLMVDSSNANNATTLYERAGMRVQDRSVVYLKRLRGTSLEEE